jgi:hypothetical protein
MVFTSFKRVTLLLLVWAGLAAQGLPALGAGVYLRNATGADVQVSNALFLETSRLADIKFSYYEPEAPFALVVQEEVYGLTLVPNPVDFPNHAVADQPS